ncbi:MAG: hypothetical protein IJ706_06740 [Clostridia bacterium]|nr:hypothetical protein [Clostridia bacterium]
MKRKILICVFSLLLVILFFIIFLYCNTCDLRLSKILEIVFQSILTGVITFASVFVTFMLNNYLYNIKKKDRNQPNIMISVEGNPSAEKKVNTKRNNVFSLTSKEDDIIREVTCVFFNCADNFFINGYIENDRLVRKEIKDRDKIVLGLLSNLNEKYEIKLYYEDVNHIHYSQLIWYSLIQNDNVIKYKFDYCKSEIIKGEIGNEKNIK